MKIAIPALDGSKYHNYRAALRSLGAEGVIVGGDCDVDDCAGLLLPGGGDVDPELYGQRNISCVGVDRALDNLQWSALARFLARGKPVLGICRGHQLVNVFFGGTLIQHIPQSARHSRDAGSDADKVHDTRIEGNSYLYTVYGPALKTNSSHHQAVDVLGEGLRAVQWSDDGVIEGFRHDTMPLYGVQWHPERMSSTAGPGPHGADGRPVLEFFLRQCRDWTKDKEA